MSPVSKEDLDNILKKQLRLQQWSKVIFTVIEDLRQEYNIPESSITIKSNSINFSVTDFDITVSRYIKDVYNTLEFKYTHIGIEVVYKCDYKEIKSAMLCNFYRPNSMDVIPDENIICSWFEDCLLLTFFT